MSKFRNNDGGARNNDSGDRNNDSGDRNNDGGDRNIEIGDRILNHDFFPIFLICAINRRLGGENAEQPGMGTHKFLKR